MSPYQQIFSANAVLGVWRNLRHNKDHSDLLLTLQYNKDDIRDRHGKKNGKNRVVEVTNELSDARAVDGSGKSIGFVVPWRSMQAQRRELREKEKELAEALVMLAGEVMFTDLSPTLQSSLTQNPLIQIRHLAAGISRQMSRIEIQMADNSPFANGKNIYTGSEIARKFLPPIQILFQQYPVPRRMIFELLMELKDLIYMGMMECTKEVLEWELDGAAIGALEELDDALVRAVTTSQHNKESEVRPGTAHSSHRKLLRRKPSTLDSKIAEPKQDKSFITQVPEELIYVLESLETTALAMTHLPVPIPDMCGHAIITLRRLVPRHTLSAHVMDRKRRAGRCAEYAQCMKWAGTSWRQNGGCRRGCKNEDEDPENLPSWHRSSRWFSDQGSGTCMVGGGRPDQQIDDAV